MSDTRWLRDDEQAAWLAFIAVVLTLPTALDAQLQRDAAMTHFEYLVLAMLSAAPERTLSMSALAARSSSSLSRLSHAVAKMERRGWVRRQPSAHDGRVTVASMTNAGWDKIVEAAPGHVDAVRRLVFDALTPGQVAQLQALGEAMLTKLDPEGRLAATPVT